MGKWLNGACGTGKKIMANWNSFNCILSNHISSTEDDLYQFNWTFDNQKGYIVITVKDDKISNSSLVNTAVNSIRKFVRPLSLYNDMSLEQVFTKILESNGISVSGVYEEEPEYSFDIDNTKLDITYTFEDFEEE